MKFDLEFFAEKYKYLHRLNWVLTARGSAQPGTDYF